MAEPRQITFSYQELAELLVRQQDIHEGLWGVYVELGIGGAIISVTEGADAVLAAIVPLQRMGIQKLDAEVPGLTVDAAKVNPANGVSSRVGGGKNADEA